MDPVVEWLELAEARIQLMHDAVRFVTDRSADSLVALQDVLDYRGGAGAAQHERQVAEHLRRRRATVM